MYLKKPYKMGSKLGFSGITLIVGIMQANEKMVKLKISETKDFVPID